MRIARLFSFIVLATTIISLGTPTASYAKTAGAHASNASQTTDFAKKPQQSQLTVTNRTGGVLYVHLSGAKEYFFAAAAQGKTSFPVEAGKYTAVITSSACGGSLTYHLKISGNSSIRAIVCR